MKRHLAFAAAALIAAFSLSADDLPRRGSIGILVAPAEGGVSVRQVLAGSSGEAAGVQAGDVITKVNGTAVTAPAAFNVAAGRPNPGDKIAIEVRRGTNAPETKELIAREYPRETSSEFDVIYGHVTADDNRYRTIVTKPKGGGPHPMLYFVQGVGCFSVDNPPTSFSYLPIVHELTRRGYATLRVDKPGTGDSEGGPCPTVDFHAEVRAYEAALKSVGGMAFVDKRNVFLFGHSMGGIMAPRIAQALPLRGIAVYGTGFNSWLAYTLENTRRQMRLAGADYVDIAEAEKQTELLGSLLYVQKMPLEEIVKKHPQFAQQFPDGKTFAAGKHATYFQQIYDLNFAKGWKPYEGAVLSLWGSSDFVSNESDHRWLVDAMNHYKPGRAKFMLLENTDHWLNVAKDYQQSREQGPYNGKFNPRFTETVFSWMEANGAK